VFEILPALIMSVAMMFTLARLIRGPRLESRVVASDLLTIIGIGLIATYSVMTEQTVFLDIAIVLALVSFLGTIAFAYYLERQR